jgi:hypothetical protein
LLREVANRLADELVLFAQVVVHASRPASSTSSRTPQPVPPRCVR